MDSTLADFLDTTGTGVLWNSQRKDVGMDALAKVLTLNPSDRQWQTARDQYFGERNLSVMQRVLGGGPL